jgi:hypothetical protein
MAALSTTSAFANGTASAFTSSFPTTDTQSTLSPSQTSIPLASSCGGGLETINNVNPACAIAVDDNAATLLQTCCNGAPRVLYDGGCNMYCEARNQSLVQLNDCILRNKAQNETGNFILICNRVGASFSSLLPVETESRTSTGSAPSKTAGAERVVGTLSKGACIVVGMVVFNSLMGLTL